MTKDEISPEIRILQAAEELFLQKGFAATSTTDIARKVGCNQALVHYYFRTKENLFEQIFLKKAEMIVAFFASYQYNGNFFELLDMVIAQYFALFEANKSLPQFVLSELVMNGRRRDFIRRHFIENENRKFVFERLDGIVQEAVAQKQIRPIATIDLMMNVMSLTVNTFVILPIYADWMEVDEASLNAFIAHRKEEVRRTIFNDLKALP